MATWHVRGERTRAFLSSCCLTCRYIMTETAMSRAMQDDFYKFQYTIILTGNELGCKNVYHTVNIGVYDERKKKLTIVDNFII